MKQVSMLSGKRGGGGRWKLSFPAYMLSQLACIVLQSVSVYVCAVCYMRRGVPE